MADNVRLQEIVEVPNNTTIPPEPNTNDSRLSSGLLMTHSTSPSQSAPSISLRGFNFGNRTMEHSNIFANNISSTIQEIRPFIEHARAQSGITLSSLWNIRAQNPTNDTALASDNYIINVEEQPGNSASLQDVSVHGNHHHHETTATDNFLNNIREAANEVSSEVPNNNSNNAVNHNNNNNNNDGSTEENSAEAVQIGPETRALLRVLQKYIPFVTILLMKGIYDHRASIANFVVLFITFHHANNVIKREIAKQHNKSWMSLLVVTCYIIGCIFINFDYETHLFSLYTPLTIGELLWSVLITDFILKLITMILKLFLTCLPSKILALRERGKYYLVMEAASQVYRCAAPIQPWLYYLLDAYQGPEKIVGIFLSLLYTVCKGNDLLSRVKYFCTAFVKILQNVNLGVAPSKEQLIASGGICAICHEEYSMPVRLQCKHIFCETCVLTWLNRECSCPLCRAAITDDPIYRDGHTTHFIQLY